MAAGSGSKAEQLSEETVNYIRTVFKSKDVDGNGYIERNELGECLRAVGFIPTEEDLTFLQKAFDTNGDGKLSVDEIVANLDVVYIHSLRGDEILEAFKVFDKNGDGFIRLPELNKILIANNAMTPQEARELLSDLIREYDKNHDGRFDYTEFVAMFMSDDNPLQLPNH